VPLLDYVVASRISSGHSTVR